ncbi:large subunit terminase [uncultured Mediterranean phage uvMED]|nr:large subunit terminase [uncultured Mediterranean phage uvMED]
MVSNIPGLKLDFSKSPTVWKFLNDNSFVRGMIGPVGSGKSYACCAEIFKRAVQQKPSKRDGIKYSRFVIVRNSYPMLKTTTLKTWLELFPEHIYGSVRNSPPITHHIKLPSREGAAGIDLEVIFLALDQPKDVRKLLSLEVTGGWINEARELPKSIVDGLTHRVGRYPVKDDGGPTWRGVILDTNPCDDDHWIYRLSEKEPPKGKFAWKFFRQPPGVFEAKEVPEEMPEAQGFVHSAGKWWQTNDKAENLNNLPVGYYEQLLGGKNLDWIRCYAEGKFTYVQEGKPVWSEYDDASMVDDCQILEGVPIQIGLDFGLTPAAVFAQRTPKGVWNVLHELVTFDMGLERFCTLLKEDIDRFFPKHELQIWGDPAGMQRDQIFENTSFEHLKTHGLFAKPTATNDFRTRREALAMPMTRLVENKPGFRIDRKCVRLRKSLSGGYHFKRVAIGAGQERFRDTPNKNEHSHIGDAAGYCLLGGGEHRRMTKGNRPHLKPMVAKIDFDPLA